MFKIRASFGNWIASHGNSTFQLPLKFYFFFNYSRYLEPSNTLHTCFSPFVNPIPFCLVSGPWDQPRDSAGSFLSVLAPQSPFTSQSQSFLLLIPPTEAGHRMTPSAAAQRGIL